MTLTEKIEFIKKEKEKNNLFISKKFIRGGAKLIYDFDSLETYEKMEENTKEFAEKIIINLVSNATNEKEAEEYFDFNLVFCGDFNELPKNRGEFSEFITKNKERIIAVYRYAYATEQTYNFNTFGRFDSNNEYKNIYLNYAKLIEILDNNNIKFRINPEVDCYAPIEKNDLNTEFVFSYSTTKKLNDENGYQLKKTR